MIALGIYEGGVCMRKLTMAGITTALVAPTTACLAFAACTSSGTGNSPGLDSGGDTTSDALSPDVTNDVVTTPDGGSDVNMAPDAEAGAQYMHFIALNGLLCPRNVRYCFAANATGDPGPLDIVSMDPQPADPRAGARVPVADPGPGDRGGEEHQASNRRLSHARRSSVSSPP